MNKAVEGKLERRPDTPAEDERGHRFLGRIVVIAVLLAGLACGMALAAATWGTKDYAMYGDPKTNGAAVAHITRAG